jgi:hypothetical protein
MGEKLHVVFQVIGSTSKPAKEMKYNIPKGNVLVILQLGDEIMNYLVPETEYATLAFDFDVNNPVPAVNEETIH